MATTAELIISALIGVAGLSVAVVYLLLRCCAARLRMSPIYDLETPGGARRRDHRRLLGMAILAIVSVGLFMGINFIDPLQFPVEFSLFWMIILLMVLWLLALAFADIRHTLKLHRAWTRRRAQRSMAAYNALGNGTVDPETHSNGGAP